MSFFTLRKYSLCVRAKYVSKNICGKADVTLDGFHTPPATPNLGDQLTKETFWCWTEILQRFNATLTGGTYTQTLMRERLDLVVHSILVCLVQTPQFILNCNLKGLFFCLSQVHYPRINPFFLLFFSFVSHMHQLSHMHALINTLRVFVCQIDLG